MLFLKIIVICICLKLSTIKLERDYSFVILPDTQYYSGSYEQTFRDQVNFVLSCKNEENIEFVSHVGDIVHRGNKESYQWRVAKSVFDRLLTFNVAHGFLPGNHDVTFYDEKDSETLDPHFYYNISLPLHWYQDREWFGGYFPENGTVPLRNSFQIIKKKNILFFHLEYIYQIQSELERVELFKWIDKIISNYTNKDTKIFISSHMVGGPCSNGIPTEFQILIEKYCNLIALFGGHVIGCTGEFLNYHLNNCGRYVPAFVSNYQVRKHGGDGLLRQYMIKPNENKTCVYTYSPKLDQYEIDSDSHFSILNWNASQIESGCSLQKKCRKLMITPTFVITHQIILTFILILFYYLNIE